MYNEINLLNETFSFVSIHGFNFGQIDQLCIISAWPYTGSISITITINRIRLVSHF